MALAPTLPNLAVSTQGKGKRLGIVHSWQAADAAVLRAIVSCYADEITEFEAMGSFASGSDLVRKAAAVLKFGSAILIGRPREIRWRGIVIGQGVSDWCIRLSEDGRLHYGRKLLRCIYGAIRNVDGAFALFRSRSVVMVLGTDESYYQYAITAQVARRNGLVPLLFRGGQTSRLDVYSCEKLTGYSDFEEYPACAQGLGRGTLDECLVSLDRIASGQQSLCYMPSKSGSEPSVEASLAAGSHILYLHDFYDAVGVFGWTIFNDHFDWCSHVADTLLALKQKVAIKLHPNQRPENQNAIQALKQRYGDRVQWLEDIRLTDVAKHNPAAIYTVYGSVTLEAARLNINVVTAGRNPFIAFNFAWHPRSVAELNDAIRRIVDGAHVDIDQDEVARAYYSHHVLARVNSYPIPVTDLSAADWNELYPARPRPSHNYDRFAAIWADPKFLDFALERFSRCRDRLIGSVNAALNGEAVHRTCKTRKSAAQ